jgi:hypothetical protein
MRDDQRYGALAKGMKLKLLALLAVAMMVSSGALPPTDPPINVSALVTRDGLMFDSPIPLPWEASVPAGLRQEALTAAADRRRQLFARRDDYGNTEVPFPLPLSADLRRRAYYFLSPTGVREIHPKGLLGTVRIVWDEDRDTIQRVEVFGEVQAPAGAASGGGFVLITTQPVRLTTEPSDLTADALLSPHGEPYKGRNTPFRQIVRQYQVRQTAPSPDRWVLVQWLPDTAMVEAGCAVRLSLFHLGPEPSQVATLDAACDV